MKWITKKLELIAVNFLLKRGYEVTFPMIYFSGKRDRFIGSATYWQGKSK